MERYFKKRKIICISDLLSNPHEFYNIHKRKRMLEKTASENILPIFINHNTSKYVYDRKKLASNFYPYDAIILLEHDLNKRLDPIDSESQYMNPSIIVLPIKNIWIHIFDDKYTHICNNRAKHDDSFLCFKNKNTHINLPTDETFYFSNIDEREVDKINELIKDKKGGAFPNPYFQCTEILCDYTLLSMQTIYFQALFDGMIDFIDTPEKSEHFYYFLQDNNMLYNEDEPETKADKNELEDKTDNKYSATDCDDDEIPF